MQIIHKNLCTILIAMVSLAVVNGYGQDTTKQTIETKLPVPFGTLTTLTVKIVNGNDSQQKQYAGRYLLAVLAIDTIRLEKGILIPFEDKTGVFPTTDFELYNMLYGKETESLSSDKIAKMNKAYVGKEFTIIAYETGTFTGKPKMSAAIEKKLPLVNRLESTSLSFHFKNYLIIVANSSKEE